MAEIDSAPAAPTTNSPAASDVSQPADADVPAQGPSKKAQKRAAKAAMLAEKKLERRARERAAKKEKKKLKRDHGEGWYEDDVPEPSVKKAKREGPVRPFDARVVIDLGFDVMMTDKEMISLASQLAYTYSANRRAERPFASLLFTSLNGRLRTKLDKQNDACYRRWEKTEWWEEGYDGLWAEKEDSEKSRSRSEKDKVIYLTADAEDEIEELREGETYIIGGIVDHNRYKNLCQKKAVEGGIHSARLPIGKYVANLATRKVLTVNQVFEILVRWTESRDWEKAMYSVMPKRKFQQPTTNTSQSPGKDDEGDMDEENAEPAEVGNEEVS